ncbi:MAG: thiosulfate oxidation carrier protein SoxY [Gammaproteobacteria bacterium]|nr:thiosulfate oxidation carrier protein SoxY [Gammaproteobacteria bacterium]MBU1655915.1 thiosulfate oxidation carrier protein SoxY [Gammaproteobacteria bacterium]MBU1961787.1 thiosulfate oxidation carrier protein SoxY [Gammaproteobacteria bacterium]
MNPLRRAFLKGGGYIGMVAVAVATGLLRPGQVLAAWNKAGFEAKAADEALQTLGVAGATESADIEIKAPDIAENGAMVPVEVTSKIAGTEQISIVAEKNERPLVAVFNLKGTEGYISTRIKMAKTSNVIIYVKAGGAAYFAKKEVKVTIGGCGG